MHNVMLDLETMGNGPRAAIVSIGAVFFDPLTGELGAQFEAVIDLRNSAKYGEIDPDTVLWWLRQSDEARAQISGQGYVLLSEALWDLSSWITKSCSLPNVKLWGNGASFDNVILRNAYEATIKVAPWDYWNDRDVRTIVDLGRSLLGFDPKKELPFEGVRHSALDDAKHQARYVSAIYRRMLAAVNGCDMVRG
ncbi:3'-5' exonuclease [Aeromonas media]|uniref:3'-5' exonuclease n=1 Tax=Aeromonas media TaxID=651 RepID=UPI0015FA71B6|nr:3'-5' exonuclease [Aeromonas media]